MTKAFEHPAEPHERKHGPSGYVRYSQYKDWLRDEFYFRCVYCLIRERWYPNGSDSFSVEHLQPKSDCPALECVYENLVYACVRCNTARGTKATYDPCKTVVGIHVDDEGVAFSSSSDGKKFIEVFDLNNSELIRFRKDKIRAITKAETDGDHETLDYLLGYPTDMPNLTRKTKCANSKPESAKLCHFIRNENGKLPKRY